MAAKVQAAIIIIIIIIKALIKVTLSRKNYVAGALSNNVTSQHYIQYIIRQTKCGKDKF